MDHYNSWYRRDYYFILYKYEQYSELKHLGLETSLVKLASSTLYNTYLSLYVLYFGCSCFIYHILILIKVIFLCITSKTFPTSSTELGIAHLHCKTGALLIFYIL